jgi:hypothetical protein
MEAEATFWRSSPVKALCWWTAVPPKSFDANHGVAWRERKVHTLFNTHHHVDQTGNNELFSTGTKDHRAQAHAGVDVGRPLDSG